MTTLNRRGRPPKFDRDQAIQIARELFHARGYEGVGVAELGTAMGIKPPSLYAAFGNKQRLYELALDDYVCTAGDWIPDILSRAKPINDVIGTLFEEAANQYTANRESPGCMVLNGARNTTDQEVSTLARVRCAATRELLEARFAQDRIDDTDALADYAMLVLHGLSAGASAGWSRTVSKRAASAAAVGFAALAVSSE